MGENYQGKIGMVTGAARGIGKAVAHKLAQCGADVILLDINKETVEASAKEIAEMTGCRTWAFAVDVTSADALDAMMTEVDRKIGCVDVLANCAGMTVSKCLVDVTTDDWDRVMNVNLRSVWYLSRLYAKQLKAAGKSKGNIVSISSQASKIGEYGNGAYSISKAGVNMLTQVLGLELAAQGISVSAICPGYVNTEMVQEVFRKRAPLEGMTPEQYEKALTGSVPMSRMAEPEEIADLVAFLAGGHADYITGVTVTIAGGKTLI